MEQLGSLRPNFLFLKYDILEFLKKSIEKVQASLKYEKNNWKVT
jgi:hypothetical protein